MAEQFDVFSEEASRDRVVTRAASGVVKLEQPTIPMNEEGMVRYLSETGRYRILRKLVPRAIAPFPRPEYSLRARFDLSETDRRSNIFFLKHNFVDPRFTPVELCSKGIILDTETTGLNSRKDEIVEIGVIAFTFDAKGNMGDVTGIYGGLQQPSVSIPSDITKLTGITDEMVAGQSIDIVALEHNSTGVKRGSTKLCFKKKILERRSVSLRSKRALKALIEPADLVIAHNAGFDRPFCEAFSQLFSGKAWACSNSEIDWSSRGYEGTKLGYLIGQTGYFHDGHRAVDDCFALLEVLAREAVDRLPPRSRNSTKQANGRVSGCSRKTAPSK